MILPPRVAPLAASKLEELPGDETYDAVLASLGFERRCTEIPAALGEVVKRAAVPFFDRREGSYRENERFFRKSGWELAAIENESQVPAWISQWLRERGPEEGVRRLAVDVSSMKRTRIAAVVEAVIEHLTACELEIDFLYTPSSFRAPAENNDPPVLSVRPVSGYFAGWWHDLDAPLHAIIGLGYELERASSAIDQLEPEILEAFIPVGTDGAYLTALERANQELFDTQDLKHVTHYEVADPFTCFRTLESRVHGIAERHRVALVPLGPKIFATCVLIVAALHPGAVQVIRVSAEEREHAVDYRSDGSVYGLRLVLGPPRAGSEMGPANPGSMAVADVEDDR